MIKSTSFLLGLILLGMSGFSSPVSENVTRQVAINQFFTQVHQQVNEDVSLIHPQLLYIRYDGGVAIYHVYGFSNLKGWVMVAADDLSYPILGYSSEGNYALDPAAQPPAFKYLTNLYTNRIQEAISSNTVVAEDVQVQWQKFTNNDLYNTDSPLSVVSPLMTTTWDQNCYYNTSCPATTAPAHNPGPCGHVYTGCEATAPAQVMKYWNFPGHGTGSNTYVDPDSYDSYGYMLDPSYGSQSANFNVNYNWDNMPDAATDNSTSIPQLMYHCGVAVNMDYTYQGSGASPSALIPAMTTHFYYSTDIHMETYLSYTSSQWTTMLKNDLLAGKPTMPFGYEPSTEGHIWVCDGFQDNYTGNGTTWFHMNWGWSGSGNGYFVFSDLSPGNNVFNNGLGCFFNIHPGSQNPIAPTAVTASQGTYSGQVHVSWRWASNATYYQVYRSSTNNSASATALSGWQAATDYYDITAIPYNVYYYFVKSATSSAGANPSAFSNSAYGYTSSPFQLTSNTPIISSETPRYFDFNQNVAYWGVVGVRPASAEDWDINEYADVNYTPSVASSTYGAGAVDFTVVDGNHTTGIKGIKLNRYSGSSICTVEYDGGSDVLSVANNTNLSMSNLDVVKIWDIYLSPGTYKFTMTMNSGTADLGIGLFSSASGTYYYGRNAAIGSSDATTGGGSETFTVTITSGAYYGFVVWSNAAASGNFNVNVERAGTWTGAVDHNWNTAGNWSANIIPTATIDVDIPNVTNKPWIWTADAVCKNLLLESGSGNLLRVFNLTLTVNGTATLYGMLQMDNNVNTAGCIFSGNVIWGTGSSASVTALPYIHVYGNWDFQLGSAVHLNSGTVGFYGAQASYIRVFESNHNFNTLSDYTSGGYGLYLDGISSHSLKINGDLNLYSASYFFSQTDSLIYLKGNLLNSGGHFQCYQGKLVCNGASQSITLASGDVMNHLVINPSGTVSLNSDIFITWTMTISSGVLNSNSHTITLGGDWNNNVGPAAFTEAAGRVVFSSASFTYYQYCSNETFNILEVNNTNGGGLGVVGPNSVVCATYDWTAGSVQVYNGGSFTANTLTDNGIAGTYIVHAGGLIALHNAAGYVDLNGNISMDGGEMDVYGGTTDSYWPFTANASVTMSGGILDFKNTGIKLNNSSAYSFTENITGGIIRTVGNFYADRADFSPYGGTAELYGATNCNTSTQNGGSFNNLKINKSVVSNIASIINTFYINGNLEIDAGSLASAGNTIFIHGNWTNNVGDAGFGESTGTVNFNWSNSSLITTDEKFYNLNLSKTFVGTNGLELLTGKTLTVLNAMNLVMGTMQLDNSATLNVKDFIMASGSGLNTSATNTVINITGGWTDNTTTTTPNAGFYHGTSNTVNFIQGIDQSMHAAKSLEEFNNLTINKPGANFSPYVSIEVTGDFNVTAGTFNYGASNLNHYFDGNFNAASGTTWYNGTSTVNFTGIQDQTVYFNPASGYFYHVAVTKPAAKTLTLLSNVVSLNTGHLNVNSGKLDLNGHFYRCTGNVTVSSTGIINIPASSWLEVGANATLAVNNGGMLALLGTLANPASLTHNSGNYYCNIESGGTISAENAIFEYMHTNGIYVKSGALVDALHPFTSCTFRNGVAGGTLLKIDNNQTINVNNAVFPTNTWSGTSNVTKSLNQGIVNFLSYTGAFGGTAYENDPNDRVFWMPAGGNQLSGTLTYDNSGSSVLTNTRALLKNGTTVIDSVMTNAAGFFAFPSEPAGSYTLGGRSTKAWGGVNSTDALKTMQHFVHIITLSPLRFKAADVDANATANSIDALMIMKRFVGQITSFPVGDWAFETPAVNLATGVTVQNYKGICYGDADGSYLPPAKHEPQVQLVNNGVLAVKQGDVITIPISVTRDVEVGAISLELSGIPDGFSLLGITTKQGTQNLVYNYGDGNLRIGWANTEPLVLKANDNLLNLEFRVMSVPANGNLRINLETGPDCELADGNADVLYKEVLAMPELLFDNTDAFVLGDCYPNPTAGNGIIPYYLPDDGRVSLSVTDVTGRTLQAYDLGDQNAGNHQFSLKGKDLSQGVYNYTLEYNNSKGKFLQTKRLIITR